MSVISRIASLKKLGRKAYRNAYVSEHVKTSLPIQIRTLREQEGRNWTQSQLAREAGTTQTVISRLENQDYGNLSLNSLLKLAAAFDIALLVKFVPFSRLLKEFEDVSPESLEVSPFNDEIGILQRWAADEPTQPQQQTASRTLRLVEAPQTGSRIVQTSFRFGPDLGIVSAQETSPEPLSLESNNGTSSINWSAPLALRG